eukprot:1568388-Pyramimonas_sp.AAC.2
MGPWSSRRRGLPNWVRVTHAGGPSGAVDGAARGAAKRVRGAPNWLWHMTRAGGPIRASCGGSRYRADEHDF